MGGASLGLASIATKISSHRTREVFERYNIENTADVERAMEQMDASYHAEDANIEQPNTHLS